MLRGRTHTMCGLRLPRVHPTCRVTPVNHLSRCHLPSCLILSPKLISIILLTSQAQRNHSPEQKKRLLGRCCGLGSSRPRYGLRHLTVSNLYLPKTGYFRSEIFIFRPKITSHLNYVICVKKNWVFEPEVTYLFPY